MVVKYYFKFVVAAGVEVAPGAHGLTPLKYTVTEVTIGVYNATVPVLLIVDPEGLFDVLLGQHAPHYSMIYVLLLARDLADAFEALPVRPLVQRSGRSVHGERSILMRFLYKFVDRQLFQVGVGGVRLHTCYGHGLPEHSIQHCFELSVLLRVDCSAKFISRNRFEVNLLI